MENLLFLLGLLSVIFMILSKLSRNFGDLLALKSFAFNVVILVTLFSTEESFFIFYIIAAIAGIMALCNSLYILALNNEEIITGIYKKRKVSLVAYMYYILMFLYFIFLFFKI